MALKPAQLESELLEDVLERVRDRAPADQTEICAAFVRNYYHWVPASDLSDRSPVDLYGTAMAHWSLVGERKPGQTKIAIHDAGSHTNGGPSDRPAVQIVTDDMPFIVDSVNIELGRQGFGIDLLIHPVIRVRRDDQGQITEVLDPGEEDDDSIREAVVHVELSRRPEEEDQQKLREGIEWVLEQVRAAVEDWKPMVDRVQELIEELDDPPPPVEDHELTEVKEFLGWLADDNFTFLGYREYELIEAGGDNCLRVVGDTGLGLLRWKPRREQTKLTGKVLELARSPHPLVLTKANSRATVHRPAYLDYIGVKRFDDDGRMVRECRFLGLYTTRAHKASPLRIPLLRDKVQAVLDRAAFPADSHDAKALIEIIENYPRESLVQMDADELFEIATGILGLGERQRLRLLVRRDGLNRFAECVVCIPRDRFNTDNRERIAQILLDAFGASHLDWTLRLSESLVARVHYILYCADGVADDYDTAEIEGRLIHATRAWSDDLREALVQEHGEDDGMTLFERYRDAFPPGFRSDWPASAAVGDISQLEELLADHGPIISLYRPLEAHDGTARCKLYSADGISLSDVLPTFEHMGAEVVDERPYEIRLTDASPVWIYDFGLRVDAEEVERVRDAFQEAFLGVWRNQLEDDGFGALVVAAGLTGREVMVIRAIAKYLRQGGIAFSETYLERTLQSHPEVASLVVQLFKARFDPDDQDPEEAERLVECAEEKIDAVESLDEDRILRAFLTVVRATLRTNYFRVDDEGNPRYDLSFKLDPEEIEFLPRPRPRFEIFVYSPRVEGVHLRGGKVARGGLRWSDRREDFRTEILGLMKAQMVKNAQIVPVGSKGGFVVKRPPADDDDSAIKDEGIACYRIFLRGLLDVTDNIVEGEVVAPERVVRYDEDDPYLVVAADKGTASFSDIANEVAMEYGFWLGDAFASGGSRGYDHKEMGITARGAWESVSRHFRELGTDIADSDFTVVGIGDMSGDVFGNGMLLSPHIRLVAAFNHAHVFIDPDPDPESSFEERKRLFEQESSNWEDYDESILSEGGGIHRRNEKSIKLPEQIREALEIDDEQLSPDELIRAILRAPVDLLWNGGIGTYVKASTESHADVGDRGNDTVRVDANELRCRVVGEGGNLGFTQRGRIEFALAGGHINNDAVDNVAGVNCSDHEVNIKILLDGLVRDGELSEEERNELLVEMTDSVTDAVLYGSYTQTQALSLALAQAAPMVDVHSRLIRHLEQVAGLDRAIEFLPDDDTIDERKRSDQGLVAPELAVVMAYCKIHLYSVLLDSDLPEDPDLGHDLERYFPPPLPERYGEQMGSHRLRREIIATVVANQLVDRAGTTFTYRLGEETGASASLLARGYAVAREVLEMRSFWSAVEGLDNEVDADVQLEMLIEGRRLVERSTRWLVRTNPGGVDVEALIGRFEPGARELADALPEVLHGGDQERFESRLDRLREAGVPQELAARVASMFSLLAVFDIVEVANSAEREQSMVTELYFTLAEQLDLNWMRDRITELPRSNRWEALAREALRDYRQALHRALTREVLDSADSDQGSEQAIEGWIESHGKAHKRFTEMLSDIKGTRTYDMTTLSVALRELHNLVQGGPWETRSAEA